MKDYRATITVTIALRARNDEQAQERAEMLEGEIVWQAHPWAGDSEFATKVEADGEGEE